MTAKLCIFDMGGVMVDGFDVTPEMAEKVGLTPEELLPLLDAAGYDALHKGLISSPEFWQRFRANTGVQAAAEYWGELFRPVRRPRMYDLVQRLRAGGIRVVAGTNTLDSHYRIHSERGDYAVFDHTYASNLMHLAKPDPAFYRHILGAEGFAPHQALFVDDMPANVTAAAGLGVHAILFEDEASVIEQVEQWVAAPA